MSLEFEHSRRRSRQERHDRPARLFPQFLMAPSTSELAKSVAIVFRRIHPFSADLAAAMGARRFWNDPHRRSVRLTPLVADHPRALTIREAEPLQR
jgi:hypothetical protein